MGEPGLQRNFLERLLIVPIFPVVGYGDVYQRGTPLPICREIAATRSPCDIAFTLHVRHHHSPLATRRFSHPLSRGLTKIDQARGEIQKQNQCNQAN